MTEKIKFIITAVCLCAAAITETISFIGLFKFKDALCRMHSSGIGDTSALFLLMLGLIVQAGFSMLAVKLALALVLFWTAAPVTSHMMARMIINEKDNDKSKTDDGK